LNQEGLPKLGVVEVATTNFGGHPPEFWADQLTKKLVDVSQDKEPHIREHVRS
jgi:hypothetical protein